MPGALHQHRISGIIHLLQRKKEPHMPSPVLQTIEKQLPLLSHDERLWLIEHLAQQLRKPSQSDDFQAEMEAMANDPEIQKELREIQEEFSVADADGLEGL
jgi:hypothetical protein